MKIDLSGPLYSALEKVSEEFEQAKSNGDEDSAQQKALQCANLLRQLAKAVPQQREIYLERAARWERIGGNVQQSASTRSMERERYDDEEELLSYGESLISKSTVTWGDIGGLDTVKQLMMETIVIAGLKKPESIKPWKGILLFGPPGTGKTLLAAAAAGSLDATFFDVKADKVLSKYFGESSKLIASLYNAARVHSPSIVFIDEFDSLSLSRSGESNDASRRTLSTLLSELDGFQDKKSDKLLLTLAATNTPWDLDQAVLSRFPRRIFVPLPDEHACTEIVKIQTQGLDISSIDVRELGSQCVNKLYSGRDITNMCQQATWNMIRKENPDLTKYAHLPFDQLKEKELRIRSLTRDDFASAFNKIKSPITKDEVRRFEEWNNDFGG
jgi:katanin p60 ATPase-containing subunit A1